MLWMRAPIACFLRHARFLQDSYTPDAATPRQMPYSGSCRGPSQPRWRDEGPCAACSNCKQGRSGGGAAALQGPGSGVTGGRNVAAQGPAAGGGAAVQEPGGPGGRPGLHAAGGQGRQAAVLRAGTPPPPPPSGEHEHSWNASHRGALYPVSS